jgi:hypothetical protein
MRRSIPTSVLLAGLALALAGCGSDSSSTPTGPNAERTTETFSGSVTARSATWHTFAVTQEGQLEVTLTETSATATIGVGIGQVTAGCTLLAYNNTAVVGTIVTGTIKPGSYCASVYDVGSITDPVTYTLTVIHP